MRNEEEILKRMKEYGKAEKDLGKKMLEEIPSPAQLTEFYKCKSARIALEWALEESGTFIPTVE